MSNELYEDIPLNMPDDYALKEKIADYALRERIAVLESQFKDLRDDVSAIRIGINKTSEDVSQLVQMTITGKMIWKALLWAGAAVSGAVAILYMLLAIKNSLYPTPVPLPDLHQHIPTISHTP